MKNFIRDFGHYFFPLYFMFYLCIFDNVQDYTTEGKVMINIVAFLFFGIIGWMYNIFQAIFIDAKENMYEVFLTGFGATSGSLLALLVPQLSYYINVYGVTIIFILTFFDIVNTYLIGQKLKSQNKRKANLTTNLRFFLVRNFALGYTTKMFGKYWSYPRAARITFPIFVVTGFVHVTNPNWPIPSLLGLLLFLLTAGCIWVGFPKLPLWFGHGYFNLYPIKWEELDRDQKYQYGSYNQTKLTSEQYNEWKHIYNEINR